MEQIKTLSHWCLSQLLQMSWGRWRWGTAEPAELSTTWRGAQQGAHRTKMTPWVWVLAVNGCHHCNPCLQPSLTHWPRWIPTTIWAFSWHLWIPRGGLGELLNMLNRARMKYLTSIISFILHRLPAKSGLPAPLDRCEAEAQQVKWCAHSQEQTSESGLFPRSFILSFWACSNCPAKKMWCLRADIKLHSSNPVCWGHLRMLGETLRGIKSTRISRTHVPAVYYGRKSTH